MSQPTKQEISQLDKCNDDDEMYHITFDRLLEEKLHRLDPEWMTAMTALYDQSGNARWCA